jgi:hypothetical protein
MLVVFKGFDERRPGKDPFVFDVWAGTLQKAE